ncbi:threonine ammonia-lyase [Lentibacillus daqui]|uniref:threonine ammonia-lyase n=1 Tax=Lentibacillus daqui TaxID=2911514 RepID=UPI0022B18834|nr:threonine/serine dehydratase [Lentibacillus daqui]
MVLHVTYQDVLKAYKRVKGRVNHTPLVESTKLSSQTDANIWFKLENFQKTGSFKVRGALNKLNVLTEKELKNGVTTASAGNHAQGLAYAAALKNVSAKIVVPETTPEVKLEGIRQLGGEIIVKGKTYDEAEKYAYQFVEESGRLFVEAFEDDDIIAGQGTAALESFLKEPDFDAVVVPAGGGGLICGTALVAKAINPNIKVIGVQTHASPPWYYSYKSGKIVDVEYQDSYAEGLHGGIGQGNFELVKKVVDEFVLVEEESVAKAVYWLANEHHYMIEGSGAVGVAAFQEGLLDHLKGKKVLNLISGGNIDMKRLAEFIKKFGEVENED